MANAPRTVYVVTSGDYSDYGINAMFSSEEAAALYAEGLKTERGGSVTVEPWTVDDPHEGDRRLQTEWTVWIDMATGALEVMRPRTIFAAGTPTSTRLTEPAAWETAPIDRAPRIYATSCVSAAHAEALAIEARQQWQAETKMKYQASR